MTVNSDTGRFHAKVVSCTRKNGSRVAYVGSANFTGPGLLHNHETCIRLDTKAGDGSTLDEIDEWVGKLSRLSHEPDWSILEKACAKNRAEPI